MSKISRREFLKSVSLTAGAIVFNQFATACNAQPKLPSDYNLQAETPGSSQPAEVPFATAQTQSNYPDLAVARSGKAEDLTRQALSALGGMQRFVPQGAKVIVKPNICVAYHTYEYAATTNPWVVGAIIKMCYKQVHPRSR